MLDSRESILPVGVTHPVSVTGCRDVTELLLGVLRSIEPYEACILEAEQDGDFEVAAFLRNPTPQPLPVLQRRLTLLAGTLGLDPQRTRDWCFAEAMLNAAWSHAAPDFDESLGWAELMLRL